MLDEAGDIHFALMLSRSSEIVRRLHSQPHIGAAAEAFSKRSAISGVTAHLPCITLCSCWRVICIVFAAWATLWHSVRLS
jgi:hypothetical protein